MSDPWSQVDRPYRAFSQFCSSDDWHIILKAIAGAIVRFSEKDKAHVQLSFLDVGCGNGVATQTICEQIYALTGCLPAIHGVEPSELVRGRLSSNILAQDAGGPLKTIYPTLDDLPDNLTVDAAIFVHSTYYLKDLAAHVKRLVAKHLASKGVITALVLPEASPFFLGLPPLDNCSDGVESLFRSMGLETRSIVLTSRFLLPRIGAFRPVELEALWRFMAPKLKSVEAFSERLDGHAGSRRELDLQDHLIIGKRRT